MSEDVQTLCLRDAGSWFEPFASIKEKPCSFVNLWRFSAGLVLTVSFRACGNFSDADVPEELPELHFLHNHERANVIVNRIRAFGEVGSHG